MIWAEWEFELHTGITDGVIALLPISKARVTHRLNDYPIADIGINYEEMRRICLKLNTNVETFFTGASKSIKIKRNGTVYFAGLLEKFKITKSGDTISIDCQFSGWLQYFNKRLLTKDYNNQDPALIVKDMLTVAQALTNGSINVTYGTTTTAITRDRTLVNANIYETIKKMSRYEVKNGYDIDISNDKILTVVTRIGSDKPNIIIDETMLKTWDLDYDIDKLRNEAIALGAETGDTTIKVTVSNTPSQALWQIRQVKETFYSVTQLTTLTDHANDLIQTDIQSYPTITIVEKPYTVLDISVGDVITVNIQTFFSKNMRVRIKEVEINQGAEIMKLQFDI